MWAHNGILVADRGFSSTQDYDLDVDTSGHAVICFRDDRFGGTKITAQRFAPDGTPTGAAYGFANSLVQLLADPGVTHVGAHTNQPPVGSAHPLHLCKTGRNCPAFSASRQRPPSTQARANEPPAALTKATPL